MNKFWVKIIVWGLVLIVTTLSVVFIIFLRPELWSRQIVDYINSYTLQNKGIAIHFDELKGNVFTSFNMQNFRLTGKDENDLLTISEVKLKLDWKSALARKLHFSGVECYSPVFYFPELGDSLRSLLQGNQKNRFRFFKSNWDVSNILLEKGKIYFGDSLIVNDLNLLTRVSFEDDSLQVHTRYSELVVPAYNLDLNVSHLLLTVKKDTLKLSSLIAKLGEGEFNLSGDMSLSDLSGDVAFTGKNLMIYPYFSNLLKDFPIQDDRLNIDLNLSGNPLDFQLQANFTGRLLSHEIDEGRITLHIDSTGFNVPDFFAREGKSTIRLNSEFITGGSFTTDLSISGFDVSDWFETDLSTNLNGRLRLLGKGIFSRAHPWVVEMVLDSNTINGIESEKIRGKIQYISGKWKTLDTLYVELGGAHVNFFGEGNLGNLAINGDASFFSPDFARLSAAFNLPEIHGGCYGSIGVSGLITDPDLKGEVRVENFSYQKLDFNEIRGNFDIEKFLTERRGSLFIHSKNGLIINHAVTSSNVSVKIAGDTTKILSLELRDGTDFLRGSGYAIGLDFFYIGDFLTFYKGDKLQLLDPTFVKINSDTLIFSNTNLKFNDGNIRMDFHYYPGNYADGNIDFQNINAEEFIQTIGVNFPFSGLVDGIASIKVKDRKYLGEVNFSALGGRLGSLSFSRMMGDIVFRKDSIVVSNLSFIDSTNAHLVFSGRIFPVADSVKIIGDQTRIKGDVLINSLPLAKYASLIHFPFDIDGNLSGSMSFDGQFDDPVIQFSYQIDKPRFERLNGVSLSAKGRYEDFRTIITEMTVNADDGFYRVYGYIPLDLKLTGKHKIWLGEDPINLTVSGQVKHFSPLEKYVDGLESLQGNIGVALSISGTPHHPVRNGNITLKGTTVELSYFENPIQNLQGSAILTNNKMDIISCSATMYQSMPQTTWSQLMKFLSPGIKNSDRQNLSISGEMDMSKFFNPEFNLKIKGDNIYVKTPLSEQEGVVDVNLNITGRDTVAVEGEIFPEEFYIRTEFASSSLSIPEVEKKGSKYYSYNIHVPIPGNVFFQNNEVDAELEGDIYILRREQEPISFSGSVDIRRGKFHYFRDEFEIEEGTIQFEPFEWNPKLYLKAVLDITPPSSSTAQAEEDYITITLTGDLENPQIIFDSKDSKYSQSDIIALLTVNQTLYDDPLDAKKLQDESANVLGTFLEREIERNARMLSPFDVFDLRTTGNIFHPTQLDVTSVLLGRRLSPNLYLTYERSLTFTDPAQQLGLEYRLSRTTSLVGSIDQTGLIHLRYRYKYHY